MLTVDTFERLLEISRQLAETRELDPLLNTVMDTALDLMNAEYGYLVLLREDGEIEYRVRRERVGTDFSQSESQVSRSILQEVVTSRRPVITANALTDEQFARAKSVQMMRLRSVICVPLLNKDEVIGGLYIENRTEAVFFTDEHLKILQFFAAQAAVSIENARLNEALEARVAHRTAELWAINERLKQEIVERKKAEEEVLRLAVERERARVLSTFIRDASHEFRTPLALIRTSLHLVSKVDDAARRDTYLQRIEDQTQVILQLVEALLLMSRLDGDEPMNKGIIDLNVLVSTSVARFEAELSAKDILLQLDENPELPRIIGSAEELGQAVGEIIENAVTHTPEGGKIVLRTYQQHDHVVIEISDSGSGILESDLPHIFERFYRGDQSHTSRGFGLGLPIADKILQRHQGGIEVETTSGQGTTFRLFLPLTLSIPEARR